MDERTPGGVSLPIRNPNAAMETGGTKGNYFPEFILGWTI
jgi:hypothetical protein